jgi:ABC-2 type transport system permease protein
MSPSHALQGLIAIASREVFKLWNQKGRLFSALVRPSLWLLVFAAGFQNVLGISILPPYETYIPYQVYIVPGLIGIVLLFNGMQSSLAMVYDREMGIMRLLLTAPLPRWYLLSCKLMAGAVLSILQAYAFLIVCLIIRIDIPLAGWLMALPAMLLAALMLGAIGLVLSVYVRQLENFAGTMNFVIFPMFFISSALYPLWKLEESGALVVYYLATVNPFTHAVELIRFAFYGKFNPVSFAVVAVTLVIAMAFAIRGYDPQRGAVGKTKRP